jgi:hypothetical protein
VDEAKLLAALGAKPGDLLPANSSDLEDRVGAVAGVVAARVVATCCLEGDGAGKAVLYVGIEERGAPHLEYNAWPAGELESTPRLPAEVEAEYQAFLGAVALAVRQGNTDEDFSAGYSLMNHSGAKVHQLHFVELAERYSSEIRNVLRGSADNEQRAMAAYLLGYAPDKSAAAAELQYAVRDPDSTVRNNAMRALAALAVFARKQSMDTPLKDVLRIPATWFIEALNSLELEDRTTAANILVTLTESRDAAIFAQLRERALPALVEMAGWRSLPRALPAFLVLGRMSGMDEGEVQAAWAQGRRADVLAKFEPAKDKDKAKDQAKEKAKK